MRGKSEVSMLTEAQASALIAMLKESARETAFSWFSNARDDEVFISADDGDIEFVLTLSRNPFEIRLHFRTKLNNIGLMRIDGAPYHANPDGTELRNTPHIHIFREGHGLDWAEPIDWFWPDRPTETLERFLVELNARFKGGIQLTTV